MKTIHLLFSLLAATFSLIAQQAPKPAVAKTIIVLPISVRFEDIKTENTYQSDRYQSAELQAEVMRAAIDRIRLLGGSSMPADSVQGFATAAEQLAGQLPEIFRKAPPAALLDSLSALAVRFGVAGILVFDILGRVGEDGSFNPFETGWDHATHLCRLRATMLQPAAPHRFWQKEAVGRFLPRPANKKFGKLIAELLEPLQLP